MKLTDSEFQRIVSYVKSNYGIVLDQKRVLIEGRMENYLIKHDYKSYHEYMNIVEANPKGEEAANLINVLTTNHTYFMREAEHFDFLKEYVLPQLRDKERQTRDICTWCAAASTGEEAYTLAMILKDYFRMVEGEWDTVLLATDISTRVLEFACRGKYLREQIEPLPETWKKCYFKRMSAEEYRVNDALKKEVLFRQFNLMNPFPFRKKFHIVFLRNVMIYFDEATKTRLIDRIYEQMELGGYLFIGTTESIDRSKTKFRYIRPSVYQKI